MKFHHANRSSALLLLFTFFLFSTIQASETNDSVGRLIFTIGKVQIIDAKGKHKKARRGTNIFQGDTIKTFNKGQAQIKFVDGARVSVRADSEFKVDGYVYTKDNKKDKSEMSLIRGGIRAVTGAIGKKNKKSYTLKTAVATIGIRGTDYSLMLCQSNCQGDTSKRVAAGLYVGVVNGGVTVTNKMGTITLDKNQYAMVGSFKLKPKMLMKPPSFLMFDKVKASRSDRIEFQKDFAKKSEKKENIKTAKKETLPKAEKESLELSSRTTNRNNTSRSSTLPPSLAKRISGGNAQVPTEVANQIKQLFSENSDKLTGIDKELADGLKSEFENAESTEQINEILEQNSEEIAKISDFIKEQSIDSDVSGGCSNILGAGCNAVSNLVESDKDSIADNIDDGTTVGDGTLPPPPLQVTRLSRFFSSSLDNELEQFEYVLESGADNRVTSFYQADSPELSLYSYSSYGLDTALVEDYGYDPSTGLSWGRWSSGNINKTLHTSDGSSIESLDYSNQSLHWVQGLEGSDNIHLPITGTRNFTLVGNTRPTDNLGNIGTLGSASLFANFDKNTVDADVTLSINQQIWRGGQQDMSLDRSNGSFLGDQLNVEVFDARGTTVGSGGRISGGLTTSPTNGGAFNYSLDATTNGQATTVSGAAVFKEAQ